MSSARDYAILWFGARTGSPGGAGSAFGGNAVLATPKHRLDGPEHLEAIANETRLDATAEHHGLLPALSGSAGDVLDGTGVFRAEAGAASFMPTLIQSGETFTVPIRRQGLFSLPITIDAGGALVVLGDLVEVH